MPKSVLSFATALLLLTTGFVLPGCDVFEDRDEDGDSTVPIFAAGTPLIAATLEASPDRDAYYHPTEVFVGTIFDPEDNDYSPFEDPSVAVDEAIYSPTLFAQVMKFMGYIHARPDPDVDAEVVVTGPMGRSEERAVTLGHKEAGVYYDAQEELSMQAGGRYRLAVTLSDGRRYQSETQIPALPRWDVPDTMMTTLFLKQYPDEPCWERNSIDHPELLPAYQPAADAVLTVDQANYSTDWADNDVPPGGFRFENRGNHRRDGAYYGIFTEGFHDARRRLGIVWEESAAPPATNHLRIWLRLSQLNADLSKFYFTEFGWIGTHEGDPSFDQEVARLDAVAYDDADYFFGVSNIEKLGADGDVLPKSDAVGVFGGYSPLYPSLTVVPIRDWDPEALVGCR